MVTIWQQRMLRVMASFSLVLMSYAADVQVLLDANRVATGEAANLVIKVTGGKAEQPEIPVVENLTLQFKGQSQMISIVNGATTQSVSFSYVVGSQVPGEYVIPSVAVKVDGQVIQTKEQSFTVVDDGSKLPAAQADPDANDPNRFGTMTVALTVSGRKDIYLGEIAPVRIQAWLPMDARVQLQSAIQPENSGFTLHNVSDQPQQSVEMKEGKQYRVLTWFGGISATKAGLQSVNLSVKAMVAIPDRSKPTLRPRRGSNPYAQGSQVSFIEKEVNYRSEDMPLEVRPLPEEGRPTNFSGAVGEFEFDALEIPAEWKTGEPQRVALRIRGSGNFAIMKAPELSPADLWKSYPGQDQFTPSDIASFSGSKVFVYNAIARKSGDYQVGFELSFFDPKQSSYRTIRSQTKSLKVTGDPIEEEKTSEVIATTPVPAAEDHDGFAPLRERDHRAIVANQVAGNLSLPVMGSVAGLLCLSAPWLAWRRRRNNDPMRREKLNLQRAIVAATSQADGCEQQGNVVEYWHAARRSLQLQLASQWNVQAHSIVLHDVLVRCGEDSPVTAFFREADRWAYGAELQQPEWGKWRNLHQLAHQAICQ